MQERPYGVDGHGDRLVFDNRVHPAGHVLGTYGHLFPAIDAKLDQALGARWNNARPTADAQISEFPS